MTCLPLVSFPPVKLFVMIRNITFTYYSAGRNGPHSSIHVLLCWSAPRPAALLPLICTQHLQSPVRTVSSRYPRIKIRACRRRITGSSPPATSQGIRNQPVPQTLFHRPLQDLLGPLLNSGEMVLDRLKELAFGHEPNRAQVQSYYNFPRFPMLLEFRLRTLGEPL
jgi:hypothetical protein